MRFFENKEIKECDNNLNFNRNMLNILKMKNESGNCENLVTENDTLQEKTTKNMRKSHNIGHTLLLNLISKEKNEELIKQK